MKVEELLKERVNNNSNLFSKDEVDEILENWKIYAKIYLLGMVDVKS